MQIYCKTIYFTYMIEIKPDSTVDNMYKKFSEIMDFPVDNLRIIYAGRNIIRSDNAISNYGISTNCTVYIICK